MQVIGPAGVGAVKSCWRWPPPTSVPKSAMVAPSWVTKTRVRAPRVDGHVAGDRHDFAGVDAQGILAAVEQEGRDGRRATLERHVAAARAEDGEDLTAPHERGLEDAQRDRAGTGTVGDDDADPRVGPFDRARVRDRRRRAGEHHGAVRAEVPAGDRELGTGAGIGRGEPGDAVGRYRVAEFRRLGGGQDEAALLVRRRKHGGRAEPRDHVRDRRVHAAESGALRSSRRGSRRAGPESRPPERRRTLRLGVRRPGGRRRAGRRGRACPWASVRARPS